MPSVPDNTNSSTYYQLLLLSTFLWYKTKQKDKLKNWAFHFENICVKADYIYGYQDFQMK